ncbi:MAG: phage holin family protein, partial [Thermoleophilia bacterium]|nr:phage holin family protein [Thermoleophilia bacterium]
MNETARRADPAVPPPPEKVPPERVSLRVRPLHIVVKLIVAAVAVYVAAWLLPGVDVAGPGGAFVAALLIAVLNVFIPPVVASLRLPFTLALGFLLAIGGDAAV